MTPEELDALVASNVRAQRARQRMTQEELADELGWLSRQPVSYLEAGTRRVTLADALGLCRALKIDLAELLHGAPADVLHTFGLT